MEPQPLHNGMVCSPAVTQAFSRLSKSNKSDTSNAPNNDGEGGAKQEEEEDDKHDGVRLTREDEVFLLEMMERDDVTVVSEGLADAVNDTLWTPEYIRGASARSTTTSSVRL